MHGHLNPKAVLTSGHTPLVLSHPIHSKPPLGGKSSQRTLNPLVEGRMHFLFLAAVATVLAIPAARAVTVLDVPPSLRTIPRSAQPLASLNGSHHSIDDLFKLRVHAVPSPDNVLHFCMSQTTTGR